MEKKKGTKKKTKLFGADITVDEEADTQSVVRNKLTIIKKLCKETEKNVQEEKKRILAHQIEHNIENFVHSITSTGVEGLRKLFHTELMHYSPQGTIISWENNKDKNRYQDITCLDETRIKLTLDVPPSTDYIHANWIKFDGHDRVYIACQGPMENTCEDFWRMIHQEQATRIMNLTKNIEDGKDKCFQYWPEKANDYKNFGKMFVQTRRVENSIPGVTVYTIEIVPDGCADSLIVKMIHLTTWPDRGCPMSGKDVLRIIKLLTTTDTLAAGPIAIHCSAGIGRTGTLILIDVVLQQLFRSANPVDIVQIFKTLRRQRAHSIQQEGQFLFAIASVLEYLSKPTMLRVIFSRSFCTNSRIVRHCSSNAVTAQSSQPGRIRQTFEKTVDSYEDFIGVKAVKEAQASVMMWEEKLSEAQIQRREKQAEIKSIQSKLKDIHVELDRTSRGEDKYLHLLTEEHALIKKERSLLESFEHLETAEREAFHKLSNKVRESHEKERERVEKTKWWSVSASLLGALIGIIGTSIGNELRMRRLKEILPIGSAKMGELARIVDEQNSTVTGFITEMRDALKFDSVKVQPAKKVDIDDENMEKVLFAIKNENARLSAQMAELTRLAKLESALAADPNAVVYVGSEMEHLLEQTERNLESKMKLQALLSAVFLYTAIGVTVPLIFAFFRGG